jgi:hypothetical protein
MQGVGKDLRSGRIERNSPADRQVIPKARQGARLSFRRLWLVQRCPITASAGTHSQEPRKCRGTRSQPVRTSMAPVWHSNLLSLTPARRYTILTRTCCRAEFTLATLPRLSLATVLALKAFWPQSIQAALLQRMLRTPPPATGRARLARGAWAFFNGMWMGAVAQASIMGHAQFRAWKVLIDADSPCAPSHHDDNALVKAPPATRSPHAMQCSAGPH